MIWGVGDGETKELFVLGNLPPLLVSSLGKGWFFLGHLKRVLLLLLITPLQTAPEEKMILPVLRGFPTYLEMRKEKGVSIRAKEACARWALVLLQESTASLF